MNAKISVFVICVDAIIYLLLYNLYDYIFKPIFAFLFFEHVNYVHYMWNNILYVVN